MNELIYNVLWIDDEHEQLDSIKRTAIDFNIKFHPYKSLMGGIEELEKNYTKYDGVLLDAKFYEREDDIAGTEDTENSIAAKERIDQIGKKFEIHVLTGQAEAFGSSMYQKVFKKVFRKGVDKDEDMLFESLRESAESQLTNQIKFQFKDVFAVCSSEYLGEDMDDRLISIAGPFIENSTEEFTAEHLNAIRKVVERVIKKLSTFNLIPREIAENKGWINGSSLFISNKHSDFGYEGELFHPLIAHSFHRLLDVLQDGSHGEGTLKWRVDEYLKTSKNLYLVKSSAYLLFEILVWFKTFIDQNPNKEVNLNLWSRKEQISASSLGDDVIGVIAQDSQGNYHCNSYILDWRFTDSNYSVGDQIEITEIIDNPKESLRGMYPKKGNRYKRV